MSAAGAGWLSRDRRRALRYWLARLLNEHSFLYPQPGQGQSAQQQAWTAQRVALSNYAEWMIKRTRGRETYEVGRQILTELRQGRTSWVIPGDPTG